MGHFGPEANAAIPDLKELLCDKTRYDKPVLSGGVGVGLGETLEAWRLNTTYVRALAAEALGQMGPEAKTAVPALTEMLDDRVADVRRSAAAALGKMGPEARPAVPALKKAAEDIDEDDSVRKTAAEALTRIGS